MEVILLQDVPKVGRKYEVHSVSAGHGRNLLLPRGLAELATPQAVARIKALAAKSEKTRGLPSVFPSGLSVTLTEKANEGGHLFAAVHAEQIAQAVNSAHGIELSPEAIAISKPIKSVGEYEVEIGGRTQTTPTTLRVAILPS